MSLVCELFKADRMIYVCKLCGFGYADEDTAERCEQLCYSKGNCRMQSKAIYTPEKTVE